MDYCRRFIVSILLIFSLSGFVPASNDPVDITYAIFNDLQSFNGTNAKLEILDTNQIDAYTDCSKVYISRGLIKLYMQHGTRPIAGILAHELTHVKYGDCYNVIEATLKQEQRADSKGKELLIAAGYSPCVMADSLLILREALGEFPDADHGTLRDRADINMCTLEEIETFEKSKGTIVEQAPAQYH